MKILKKAYRVTWDIETLEIQCNTDINYSGSETLVPDRFDSYESDSLEDVNNKIAELNLILPEETIQDELL